MTWLSANRLRVLGAMTTVLREIVRRLPEFGDGTSRFPLWESYANAGSAVLGLPPVKIGVLSGGSLATNADVKNDLVTVMVKYAEDRWYKRDEMLRLFAEYDDASRIPGVARVEDIVFGPLQLVVFKSEDKCGRFLADVVKGGYAVQAEDGILMHLYRTTKRGSAVSLGLPQVR